MTTSQDDFSPTSIDQSIDHPGELLSHDDAQLIHDVRAMFEQEKQASIERGWARIASQRAQNASSDQPSEVLDLSLYRRRNERISLVQDTTLLSSPKKDTPKKRSRLRLLSLAAAVLVCVALVGSLTLVLGATRNHNTNVGSYNTALQPTPTATPTVNPATCKDPYNPAELTLCAEGKETALNITKNFTVQMQDQHNKVTASTTLHITFLRAYADTTQLLLVYNIDQGPSLTRALAQGNNWSGFMTLTTEQGQFGSSRATTGGFLAQSFDTSSLPAGVKQLQVQSIQTGDGESLPLTFTVPINDAIQRIAVNQSVSKNGYTLTLDNLVLSPSRTTLAYEETSAVVSPWPPSVDVQSLTINGKEQTVGSNDGGSGSSTHPGRQNGTIVLDQSLLYQPGTWTITLAIDSTTPNTTSTALMTATFTFTVSD